MSLLKLYDLASEYIYEATAYYSGTAIVTRTPSGDIHIPGLNATS